MEKTVVILCLIITEMSAICRHPLICICFSESPLCLSSLKSCYQILRIAIVVTSIGILIYIYLLL
jgi:hypothetical protein